MPRRWALSVAELVVAGVLVTGCTSDGVDRDRSSRSPSPAQAATPDLRERSAPPPTPTAAHGTSRPATPPSATTAGDRVDPRWRFFVADRERHTSPWFAGAHRVMIGYGCTPAPYYRLDARCPGRQGFHHGIDVAMPCGTPLYAARAGTVVDPASVGAPGAAYGPNAFRIRSGGVDVLVGHARKVYVDPGDAVERGQLVARANDAAAPDGCHLHFEVRRAGGGLDDALDPAPYLHLR